MTRCTLGAFLPGILWLQRGDHGWHLMLPPHLALWTRVCRPQTHLPEGYEGRPQESLPYMYSETGALEMVWAGGCRLVWLPRPLL